MYYLKPCSTFVYIFNYYYIIINQKNTIIPSDSG